MILFDTHIHTHPFSPDSHQKIEEVFEKHAKSPYGFVITEHMDYGYEGPMSFEFDPKEYFATYEKYKSDKFLLGVEMGLTAQNLKQVKKTIQEYPFEMVIGSIHCVDGGVDLALPEFCKKYHKEEGYRRYLEVMYDCVKAMPEIDTLAHMDYVCRYVNYEDPELHVSEHMDALTAIFNTIIDNDISLEINTRRLGDEQAYHTVSELLRLYASLDGRYVTVGSDAHKPENIAMNFDKAEKLIAEHHLIPVYYKNRKRMEV